MSKMVIGTGAMALKLSRPGSDFEHRKSAQRDDGEANCQPCMNGAQG